MKEIKFDNLRMIATSDEDYSLKMSIASSVVTFEVTIKLDKQDFEVIEKDYERAAFLQAAFHHPFQLSDTFLTEKEQRHYLDIILHGTKPEVEAFLTEKNHGSKGAISNMLRITCNRDMSNFEQGCWFL